VGLVVKATPRPLYPRERLGTHCIGGWVGLRAGLDRWVKSRPPSTHQPGFDPRAVQPVASHYTDWVMKAPENAFYSSKITYGQITAKLKSRRQGWVFHFIYCEDSSFLGCDTIRPHRNIPTFHRNLLLCHLPWYKNKDNRCLSNIATFLWDYVALHPRMHCTW